MTVCAPWLANKEHSSWYATSTNFCTIHIFVCFSIVLTSLLFYFCVTFALWRSKKKAVWTYLIGWCQCQQLLSMISSFGLNVTLWYWYLSFKSISSLCFMLVFLWLYVGIYDKCWYKRLNITEQSTLTDLTNGNIRRHWLDCSLSCASSLFRPLPGHIWLVPCFIRWLETPLRTQVYLSCQFILSCRHVTDLLRSSSAITIINSTTYCANDRTCLPHNHLCVITLTPRGGPGWQGVPGQWPWGDKREKDERNNFGVGGQNK